MSLDADLAVLSPVTPGPGWACVMPQNISWPAGRSRSWPLDDSGRMTFLKIPSALNLTSRVEQKGFYGGPRSIVNLPSELQCQILAHLPAVDRVCLALTCKRLISLAVDSPDFRANSWTPWLFYTDAWYPSRYQLIQRLAHGWINKSQLRYCWKCQTILPRDPAYFRDKLEQKKWPHWEIKVGMPKEQWRRLSKKKRYDHIMRMWSDAEWEDSSLFSCKDCRLQIFEREVPEGTDLEKGLSTDNDVYRNQARLCPVQCPLCTETDLTRRYQIPRTKVFRPWLWRWTKRILGWIINTILVILWLFYMSLKAPIDIAKWVYRKSNGFGLRREQFLGI